MAELESMDLEQSVEELLHIQIQDGSDAVLGIMAQNGLPGLIPCAEVGIEGAQINAGVPSKVFAHKFHSGVPRLVLGVKGTGVDTINTRVTPRRF